MKLFKVISLCNCATDNDEQEMEVIGGCPNLERNWIPTGPHAFQHSGRQSYHWVLSAYIVVIAATFLSEFQKNGVEIDDINIFEKEFKVSQFILYSTECLRETMPLKVLLCRTSSSRSSLKECGIPSRTRRCIWNLIQSIQECWLNLTQYIAMCMIHENIYKF